MSQQNNEQIDPQAALDFAAREKAYLAKKAIRAEVTKQGGDIESMLGTTSDAASLAVYGLANLVAGIAAADSLEDVKAAAQPFAALSADFLAKVESGEVKLPFLQKGINTVVADIETRATAVSDAITASQKG